LTAEKRSLWGQSKEKMCVKMHKYTEISASEIQKLAMCNAIHRKRPGWTTSVDNLVEKVDNLAKSRFHAGKTREKHVDNPVETVDDFSVNPQASSRGYIFIRCWIMHDLA
jgi:adenylosuccinate synthase